MKFSVVICTHNPYRDYLERTLANLRKQTMPIDEWELIIIDNLSEPPLLTELATDWHPRVRVIVETNPGVAHARARGIQEAVGDIVLFVDDDNKLETDYLQTAWKLGEEFPYLGAWGAGKIIPEFEGEPDPEILPYTATLSLRSLDKPIWSNLNYITECNPMGAGMCVRKKIADIWVDKVKSDPARLNFGRKDKSLGACEDSDISLTACDLGLGNGVFPELRMLHLIPARRYQIDHLEKNSYGFSYSLVLFDSIRRKSPRIGESWMMRWLRLRLKPFLLTLFINRYARRIRMASDRGEYDGLNQLERLQKLS